MSSIAEIYTETVYDNLKPLYANWEPGRPIELGDFGVMRDRTFIYLGNIRDLGIKISERSDPASDNKFFASEGTTEVKFHAKGSVPVGGVVNVKAALEVSFSSKEAVFFNAAGCNYTMITDKVSLGRAVMDRYKENKWEREWAVVTDLVKAGATTVAVSGGSTASIVFEATGDVERINLADASVGLTIKTANNIGYQVVAENGLSPLFGLCQIQSAFLWWDKKFKPLSFAFADHRLIDALEVSPRVKTEESDDALFFGQRR
jgi:hypothetical protein